MAGVCAIAPRPSAGLDQALAAQDRAPDVVARDLRGMPDGLSWIWLVDGSASPRTDALSALLAAAERLEEASVAAELLASRVVDAGERTAPEHAPLSPQDEGALAVVVAPLRVLPVRAVTGASLLVRPHAVTEPIPVGPAASIAWTAQRLRGARGFLVPDSIAETRMRGGRARVDAALLLRDGLNARERLRVGMDVVERAVGWPTGVGPARTRLRSRAARRLRSRG